MLKYQQLDLACASEPQVLQHIIKLIIIPDDCLTVTHKRTQETDDVAFVKHEESILLGNDNESSESKLQTIQICRVAKCKLHVLFNKINNSDHSHAFSLTSDLDIHMLVQDI